jgi:stress-induced morphogen
MADQSLKMKIKNALRSTNYFNATEDYVNVSDGQDDDVHVVIVSDKFNGKRMKEKHDLIWSALLNSLSNDEWGQVSLTIGRSPEELKSS